LYQRKDKRFTWFRFFKIFFLAFVCISIGIYISLSSLFLSMRNDFSLFFDGFNVESSLIEDQYINTTFLELRAQQFEELIGKYHIPENMTGEGWDVLPPVSVYWNWSNKSWIYWNNTQLLNAFDPLNESDPHNDKNNMTYSGDVAHTALYEGVYTAGEAFRYAIAKRNNDKTEMAAAKARITKLVSAYELLSEVSGMGAWPRYAVPDTPIARKYFPASYFTTEDHYNVTYRGFKWTLARHISRDVYCGCLLGLAMVYALVDDPQIRIKVGDIIDKTVQFFYDCNWRIVDVDGTQHTSADLISARPMIDGSWLVYYLQMAKMVDEEKWGPIYDKYVYDRGIAYKIGRSMRMGIDLSPKIYDAYYGCNFIYYSALVSIFLCEDSVLKHLYIKNWLNVIHDFTKLHRNAFFDAIWLLCHSESGDNIYDTPTIKLNDYDLEIWKNANIKKPDDKDYIIEFCKRDIRDALMRYAERKYPSRDYYFATAPGTFPNVHQRPIPYAKYPSYGYWKDEPPSAEVIKGVLGNVAMRDVEDSGLYNNSLPSDMRKAEDIMWQRSSFSRDTTERLTSTPGRFQVPAGPEYLSVYYIAKYLGII